MELNEADQIRERDTETDYDASSGFEHGDGNEVLKTSQFQGPHSHFAALQRTVWSSLPVGAMFFKK